MNFSTYEINSANLAMQVIDYTEKAVNNKDRASGNRGKQINRFSIRFSSRLRFIEYPHWSKSKYNLSKKDLGYLLLLEVHWVDKNDHNIKYGRFIKSGK